MGGSLGAISGEVRSSRRLAFLGHSGQTQKWLQRHYPRCGTAVNLQEGFECACVCACVSVLMSECVSVCAHEWVCVCAREWVCVYLSMYAWAHVCVCVSVCWCSWRWSVVWVCVCACLNVKRDRETAEHKAITQKSNKLIENNVRCVWESGTEKEKMNGERESKGHRHKNQPRKKW